MCILSKNRLKLYGILPKYVFFFFSFTFLCQASGISVYRLGIKFTTCSGSTESLSLDHQGSPSMHTF